MQMDFFLGAAELTADVATMVKLQPNCYDATELQL
jgi:hypothetical protein